MVSKYVAVFVFVAVSYCLAESNGGPKYEGKFVGCKNRTLQGFIDSTEMKGNTYELFAKSGSDYLGTNERIGCLKIESEWNVEGTILKQTYDASKTMDEGDDPQKRVWNLELEASSVDDNTALQKDRESQLDGTHRDIFLSVEYASDDDCVVIYSFCSVQSEAATDAESVPPAREYHWAVYRITDDDDEDQCEPIKSEKEFQELLYIAKDAGMDISDLKIICKKEQDS